MVNLKEDLFKNATFYKQFSKQLDILYKQNSATSITSVHSNSTLHKSNKYIVNFDYTLLDDTITLKLLQSHDKIPLLEKCLRMKNSACIVEIRSSLESLCRQHKTRKPSITASNITKSTHTKLANKKTQTAISFKTNLSSRSKLRKFNRSNYSLTSSQRRLKKQQRLKYILKQYSVSSLSDELKEDVCKDLLYDRIVPKYQNRNLGIRRKSDSNIILQDKVQSRDYFTPATSTLFNKRKYKSKHNKTHRHNSEQNLKHHTHKPSAAVYDKSHTKHKKHKHSSQRSGGDGHEKRSNSKERSKRHHHKHHKSLESEDDVNIKKHKKHAHKTTHNTKSYIDLKHSLTIKHPKLPQPEESIHAEIHHTKHRHKKSLKERSRKHYKSHEESIRNKSPLNETEEYEKNLRYSDTDISIQTEIRSRIRSKSRARHHKKHSSHDRKTTPKYIKSRRHSDTDLSSQSKIKSKHSKYHLKQHKKHVPDEESILSKYDSIKDGELKVLYRRNNFSEKDHESTSPRHYTKRGTHPLDSIPNRNSHPEELISDKYQRRSQSHGDGTHHSRHHKRNLHKPEESIFSSRNSDLNIIIPDKELRKRSKGDGTHHSGRHKRNSHKPEEESVLSRRNSDSNIIIPDKKSRRRSKDDGTHHSRRHKRNSHKPDEESILFRRNSDSNIIILDKEPRRRSKGDDAHHSRRHKRNLHKPEESIFSRRNSDLNIIIPDKETRRRSKGDGTHHSRRHKRNSHKPEEESVLSRRNSDSNIIIPDKEPRRRSKGDGTNRSRRHKRNLHKPEEESILSRRNSDSNIIIPESKPRRRSKADGKNRSRHQDERDSFHPEESNRSKRLIRRNSESDISTRDKNTKIRSKYDNNNRFRYHKRDSRHPDDTNDSLLKEREHKKSSRTKSDSDIGELKSDEDQYENYRNIYQNHLYSIPQMENTGNSKILLCIPIVKCLSKFQESDSDVSIPKLESLKARLEEIRRLQKHTEKSNKNDAIGLKAVDSMHKSRKIMLQKKSYSETCIPKSKYCKSCIKHQNQHQHVIDEQSKNKLLTRRTSDSEILINKHRRNKSNQSPSRLRKKDIYFIPDYCVLSQTKEMLQNKVNKCRKHSNLHSGSITCQQKLLTRRKSDSDILIESNYKSRGREHNQSYNNNEINRQNCCHIDASVGMFDIVSIRDTEKKIASEKLSPRNETSKFKYPSYITEEGSFKTAKSYQSDEVKLLYLREYSQFIPDKEQNQNSPRIKHKRHSHRSKRYELKPEGDDRSNTEEKLYYVRRRRRKAMEKRLQNLETGPRRGEKRKRHRTNHHHSRIPQEKTSLQRDIISLKHRPRKDVFEHIKYDTIVPKYEMKQLIIRRNSDSNIEIRSKETKSHETVAGNYEDLENLLYGPKFRKKLTKKEIIQTTSSSGSIQINPKSKRYEAIFSKADKIIARQHRHTQSNFIGKSEKIIDETKQKQQEKYCRNDIAIITEDNFSTNEKNRKEKHERTPRKPNVDNISSELSFQGNPERMPQLKYKKEQKHVDLKTQVKFSKDSVQSNLDDHCRRTNKNIEDSDQEKQKYFRNKIEENYNTLAIPERGRTTHRKSDVKYFENSKEKKQDIKEENHRKPDSNFKTRIKPEKERSYYKKLEAYLKGQLKFLEESNKEEHDFGNRKEETQYKYREKSERERSRTIKPKENDKNQQQYFEESTKEEHDFGNRKEEKQCKYREKSERESSRTRKPKENDKNQQQYFEESTKEEHDFGGRKEEKQHKYQEKSERERSRTIKPTENDKNHQRYFEESTIEEHDFENRKEEKQYKYREKFERGRSRTKKNNKNQQQYFEESIKERNNYLMKRIEEKLKSPVKSNRRRSKDDINRRKDYHKSPINLEKQHSNYRRQEVHHKAPIDYRKKEEKVRARHENSDENLNTQLRKRTEDTPKDERTNDIVEIWRRKEKKHRENSPKHRRDRTKHRIKHTDESIQETSDAVYRKLNKHHEHKRQRAHSDINIKRNAYSIKSKTEDNASKEDTPKKEQRKTNENSVPNNGTQINSESAIKTFWNRLFGLKSQQTEEKVEQSPKIEKPSTHKIDKHDKKEDDDPENSLYYSRLHKSNEAKLRKKHKKHKQRHYKENRSDTDDQSLDKSKKIKHKRKPKQDSVSNLRKRSKNKVLSETRLCKKEEYNKGRLIKRAVRRNTKIDRSKNSPENYVRVVNSNHNKTQIAIEHEARKNAKIDRSKNIPENYVRVVNSIHNRPHIAIRRLKIEDDLFKTDSKKHIKERINSGIKLSNVQKRVETRNLNQDFFKNITLPERNPDRIFKTSSKYKRLKLDRQIILKENSTTGHKERNKYLEKYTCLSVDIIPDGSIKCKKKQPQEIYEQVLKLRRKTMPRRSIPRLKKSPNTLSDTKILQSSSTQTRIGFISESYFGTGLNQYKTNNNFIVAPFKHILNPSRTNTFIVSSEQNNYNSFNQIQPLISIKPKSATVKSPRQISPPLFKKSPRSSSPTEPSSFPPNPSLNANLLTKPIPVNSPTKPVSSSPNPSPSANPLPKPIPVNSPKRSPRTVSPRQSAKSPRNPDSNSTPKNAPKLIVSQTRLERSKTSPIVRSRRKSKLNMKLETILESYSEINETGTSDGTSSSYDCNMNSFERRKYYDNFLRKQNKNDLNTDDHLNNTTRILLSEKPQEEIQSSTHTLIKPIDEEIDNSSEQSFRTKTTCSIISDNSSVNSTRKKCKRNFIQENKDRIKLLSNKAKVNKSSTSSLSTIKSVTSSRTKLDINKITPKISESNLLDDKNNSKPYAKTLYQPKFGRKKWNLTKICSYENFPSPLVALKQKFDSKYPCKKIIKQKSLIVITKHITLNQFSYSETDLNQSNLPENINNNTIQQIYKTFNNLLNKINNIKRNKYNKINEIPRGTEIHSVVTEQVEETNLKAEIKSGLNKNISSDLNSFVNQVELIKNTSKLENNNPNSSIPVQKSNKPSDSILKSTEIMKNSPTNIISYVNKKTEYIKKATDGLPEVNKTSNEKTMEIDKNSVYSSLKKTTETKNNIQPPVSKLKSNLTCYSNEIAKNVTRKSSIPVRESSNLCYTAKTTPKRTDFSKSELSKLSNNKPDAPLKQTEQKNVLKTEDINKKIWFHNKTNRESSNSTYTAETTPKRTDFSKLGLGKLSNNKPDAPLKQTERKKNVLKTEDINKKTWFTNKTNLRESSNLTNTSSKSIKIDPKTCKKPEELTLKKTGLYTILKIEGVNGKNDNFSEINNTSSNLTNENLKINKNTSQRIDASVQRLYINPTIENYDENIKISNHIEITKPNTKTVKLKSTATRNLEIMKQHTQEYNFTKELCKGEPTQLLCLTNNYNNVIDDFKNINLCCDFSYRIYKQHSKQQNITDKTLSKNFKKLNNDIQIVEDSLSIENYIKNKLDLNPKLVLKRANTDHIIFKKSRELEMIYDILPNISKLTKSKTTENTSWSNNNWNKNIANGSKVPKNISKKISSNQSNISKPQLSNNSSTSQYVSCNASGTTEYVNAVTTLNSSSDYATSNDSQVMPPSNSDTKNVPNYIYISVGMNSFARESKSIEEIYCRQISQTQIPANLPQSKSMAKFKTNKSISRIPIKHNSSLQLMKKLDKPPKSYTPESILNTALPPTLAVKKNEDSFIKSAPKTNKDVIESASDPVICHNDLEDSEETDTSASTETDNEFKVMKKKSKGFLKRLKLFLTKPTKKM